MSSPCALTGKHCATVSHCGPEGVTRVTLHARTNVRSCRSRNAPRHTGAASHVHGAWAGTAQADDGVESSTKKKGKHPHSPRGRCTRATSACTRAATAATGAQQGPRCDEKVGGCKGAGSARWVGACQTRYLSHTASMAPTLCPAKKKQTRVYSFFLRSASGVTLTSTGCTRVMSDHG